MNRQLYDRLIQRYIDAYKGFAEREKQLEAAYKGDALGGKGYDLFGNADQKSAFEPPLVPVKACPGAAVYTPLPPNF